MNTKEEAVDYHFGAYRLAGYRQALFDGDREIAISTKLYYLLLALVRRQGEVLSKDDLIEAAWPGQVVTDTALAKQMLRVRRLINDQQRNPPYIETHRGVGYRFSEPVTRVAVAPEAAASGPPTAPRRAFPSGAMAALAALLLLVVAGIWWSARAPHDPTQAPANAADTVDHSTRSVRLALLSADDEDGWLSPGGLEFLSERLRQDPSIWTLVVRPGSGLPGDSEQQAIEITTFDNVQYAATFSFGETAEGFTVQVLLRNDRQRLAEATITGDSLGELFTATDLWLRHQLALHAALANVEQRLAGPVDSYALQSHLQGLYELLGEDDKPRAAQYFQAAINKDPDFLEAWVRLVATQLELGELQQAIATADALLQREDVRGRPTVATELYRLAGLAHARLQNDSAALDYLQKALTIVPENLDPQGRLEVLAALELRARLRGELAEAERLGLERLALAREHAPLPNLLADIHLSLAETLDQSRSWEAMRGQIEEALALYSKSGNDNGMLRGFYLLNELNFALNDMEAGVEVTNRATPYLDRATLVHEKARYYQVSAQILNLRGHFDRATAYATRLRDLAAETGNPMYSVVSEFVKVHQLYVDQRFADAFDHTQTMMAQFERDDALRAALPRNLAVACLISARVQAPEQTEALLRRFEQQYPGLREEYHNEMLRARGHLAARAGRVDEAVALLQEARHNHAQRGEAHVAQYIGSEMLEVLLAHPDRPWRPLLTELERETSHDYLLWKLKAQFLARDGDYLDAAIVMGENRLKANDLWSAGDQLLLEQWQRLAAQTGQEAVVGSE